MGSETEKISALKESISVLEEENQYLSNQAELGFHNQIISEKLHLATTDREMINILVESIVTFNSFEYAAYYQIEGDGQQLRLIAHYAMDAQLGCGAQSIAIDGVLGSKITDLDGYHPLNRTEHELSPFIPQGGELHDGYLLPISLKHELSGVLFIANNDPRTNQYNNHLTSALIPTQLFELYLGHFYHTQELLEEIDDRQRTERLAWRQQQRAERYLDVSEAIILELDRHGCISVINQRGCSILGYSEAELIGRDWFSLVFPQALQSELKAQYIKLITRQHLPDEYCENEITIGDGSSRTIDWHNVPVLDDQGQCTGMLSSGQDVTKRKNAEDKAHQLAFYDVLTGLPNRRLMLDRLLQSMVNSARDSHWKALLFLDLDNFKDLNDSLGHHRGDLMLIETTRRIKECVRENDTVSRIGGDEFVILLERLGGDAIQAANHAGSVAEKIAQQLALTYKLDGHRYESSVSIGIAQYQGQTTDLEELLKRADLAMYQAKAAGKNKYRFFDPVMQDNVNRRIALEDDLRLAILNREFELYYQPQVDAQRQCIGAEALLRWFSSERGMVSPMDFIPLAEETHLILPIGQWVLEQACQRLLLWQTSSTMRRLKLAINVSAVQFSQPTFVDEVIATIERAGVDPTRLKLEITESILVQEIETVAQKINRLREVGITFSLDDFGTGYSSLSYVKRLPLDQIKIDRSFVRDILTDPNDAAICRAMCRERPSRWRSCPRT